LTSGLALIIVLILANKLDHTIFGQFILITTVVLVVADLCDFGTGSDYLLHFQHTGSRSPKIYEEKFLQNRLGTALYLSPLVLFFGITIFGLGIAPIFTILVIMTFLRNSVAVIFRTKENYHKFLVLLVGEKVLLLILILFFHAGLQILMLESLASVSLPVLFTYPYIFRIRPNFSLKKIIRIYIHARLTGLASFVTNVALLFPLIIQFFYGSDLFSKYILLVKIFSPIPAFGAAIALVNVSSKQMPTLRVRPGLLTVAACLTFLIAVAFTAPSIIESVTNGKFVYSVFDILAVSIIAILYFLLNILVSQKLKKMQIAEIIRGYVLFILTFLLLIGFAKPFINLEVVLCCEFAAISIAIFNFMRKRRVSE
jgi:hypothetical protein